MREIKFRVWFKDEKEMSEPFDIEDLHAQECYEEGDYYVLTPDNDILYGVGREIWLQYTGLKDKSGKEIYEGDIVKNMEWVILPEAKNGCDASFGTRFEKDSPWIQKPRYREIKEREFFTDSEYGESPKDWEVIGNIYENPELLKGG